MMSNRNDSDISLIVDADNNVNLNELPQDNLNYNDYISFKVDNQKNIKYTLLKDNFVPGIEFLKNSFKEFSKTCPRDFYNDLCENFIVYLIETLNFYDVLRENLFAKNIRNKTIADPIAFIIFFRIPPEKQEKFMKYYRVEEFEEGNHLIDETKKNKALPIFNFFVENYDLEFLKDFSFDSDELKKSIKNIFKDLEYQNGTFFQIIKNIIDKTVLDFEKFLLLFSIILSFTAGLYTFYTLIDNNLQIEIFGEENDLINIAWANEYQLILSNEGRNALGKNKIDQTNFKYVKYIYLKYYPNIHHYYQHFNKKNDQIDCNQDHVIPNSCNSCSNLRNIDKIRLMSQTLDDIVNFHSLKKFPLFMSTTIKRDLSHYTEKLFFYNPFLSEGNRKTVINYRNTFGEKVGFYYLWMSHLLKWLISFSILTIIFYYIPSTQYFKIKVFKLSEFSLDQIFSLIIIIFLSLYARSWKAYEKRYAKKWGVSDFFIAERNLEKFECERFINVNSIRIPIKNIYKYILHYSISILVTSIMILITIYFLTCLQNFTSYLKNHTKELDLIFFTVSEQFKKNLKGYVSYIPILISFYIKLFAYFFEKVAKWLTDIENHQKQYQYDNSLIIKTFLFSLVNEYYTFYYIIFFIARKDGLVNGKACSDSIIFQLKAIFFTNLTINLVKEICKPMIKYYYNNYKIKSFLEYKLNKKFDSDDIHFKSYLNDNRHLICKDVSSIIGEYDQILKIFGYICQFGCLNPVFFLLFTLFVYLQRLLDAYKMIRYSNLVVYSSTSGIGVYNKIIKLFTYLSIFINVYMIFFIKHYDNIAKNKNNFYNFIVVQNILFLAAYFIDYDFLPSWFNYFSTITYDFSKNLMVAAAGKEMSLPSEIYNNIGITNQFKIN